MPLFLDVHKHVPGVKAKDAAEAHMKDLQVKAATASSTCVIG